MRRFIETIFKIFKKERTSFEIVKYKVKIFFTGERPHEAFLSASKLLRYEDEQIMSMLSNGAYRDGLSFESPYFSPGMAEYNYKKAINIGKMLKTIEGVKTEVVTVIRPTSR